MGKPQCDLVMKGGITSGVVFPRAIHKLSETYRLRNIAGTSAGAIAAVLAAAAQYRENRVSDGKSFDPLGALPNELGGPADKRGGTKMLELFQPTPALRSLYDLVMKILRLKEIFKTRRRRSSIGARLGAWLQAAWGGISILVLLLFRLGPWPVLLALPGAGIAIGIALKSGPLRGVVLLGFVSAIMLAVVGFLIGALLGVVGRAKKITGPSNLFGICTGMEQPAGRGAPALTTWMHEKIQQLAGRKGDDTPVTFDDIEKDDVHLRTMTTCITHGRPYLLPFSKGSFFFDPDEFRRLLPEKVVQYLEGQARGLLRDWGENGSERSLLAAAMAYPRLPLPRSDGLPILLAARMSLSFPILLSAVPLWTFDFRRSDLHSARKEWTTWKGDAAGAAWFDALRAHAVSDAEWVQDFDREPAGSPDSRMQIETTWFSDGGICSNFPVHLFDQLIPKWPTFAINLRYHSETLSDAERVKLAQTNSDEKEPYWNRLSGGHAGSAGSLGSFVGGILGTMKDWADNTLMTVPGYPDRIAHVNLQSDEGGLNLEMTPDQIADLGGWGEEAATDLIGRFNNPNPGKGELSWDNHRWTRLRSTLGVLQKQLGRLQVSFNYSGPESTRTYQELIERGKDELPDSYRWAAPVTQAKIAKDALDTIGTLLIDIEKGYADGFRDRNEPNPEPELRLRPPL